MLKWDKEKGGPSGDRGDYMKSSNNYINVSGETVAGNLHKQISYQ